MAQEPKLSRIEWQAVSIGLRDAATCGCGDRPRSGSFGMRLSRLWRMLTDLPRDAATRRFVLGVLVAFLPAAVIGALAHDFIKTVLFESPRFRITRQIDEHLPQPREIDAQDGEDRAELDQHLEGLAGRAEAQEMTGEQDVACRRDGDEFGQPLEEAEQEGFDDRLVFHGCSRMAPNGRRLLVTTPNCPYSSTCFGVPGIGRQRFTVCAQKWPEPRT